MNVEIIEKIEATLMALLATFNRQELSIIDTNLKEVEDNLNDSVQQLLFFMHQKGLGYESFLSEKCQPIIDFYLAPLTMQQQLLLSQNRLNDFFASIPLVEAHVIHNKIKKAQKKSAEQKQRLLPDQTSILEFSHYQKPLGDMDKEKITQLKQFLSTADNEGYMDHFYQLKQGELSIVSNRQAYNKQMLLYSELSPLQQLIAQQLFTQKQKKAQRKAAITA